MYGHNHITDIEMKIQYNSLFYMSIPGGDEASSGQLCGMPDEDELIEASLVAANKVYEVQEDSLVPIADSWGQMPKIEILQSDKVYDCYF